MLGLGQIVKDSLPALLFNAKSTDDCGICGC